MGKPGGFVPIARPTHVARCGHSIELGRAARTRESAMGIDGRPIARPRPRTPACTDPIAHDGHLHWPDRQMGTRPDTGSRPGINGLLKDLYLSVYEGRNTRRGYIPSPQEFGETNSAHY
jgi:hypothetical protein